MDMGIIHVVDHAHEYKMSFQMFLRRSNVCLIEVPCESLPLHLLNLLSILECCLLHWRIIICALVWMEFVVYCIVWWELDQTKCVPCWKCGECMVSFLMEWVSQWYLNHFCILHQLVVVAGQKLHLMLWQNIWIVFHWVAGIVYDLRESR